MSASPRPAGGDDRRSTPEERLAQRIFDVPEPDEFIRAARLAAAMADAKTGGPTDPPSGDDREKLIHNEQTKLTATLINGVALAFLVGGGVTTLQNLKPAGTIQDLILALIWVVVGFVLHYVGRLVLRNLR